jgi:hypothetical protein
VYILSLHEIHKVVVELSLKHIVQIVTGNGSNYKKACKMIIRKFLIVWHPCLAHTINLMLKAVGEFLKHKVVILVGRRMCRWLYNHNKLHAMMRDAIGCELVKWNATHVLRKHASSKGQVHDMDGFT